MADNEIVEKKMILPEGIPPLNTYYVYLTGGCNLACRHCWIAPTYQATGGTGGHLDYDLFALAIEQGLPLGLRNVKLTGGEPLLHPDFTRMVELLKEKELGLTIETNGVLLTLALARFLKEKSTMGFISVSLDGAKPETHDSFRGVKGSFEKTCQGIRYLVEVGYRPQVIMSIHDGNVGDIEALVHLVQSLGAGSVKFNIINPSGRGEVMIEREQTLSITELIDIGNWIERDLQKRFDFPLYYSWPMAFYTLKRLHDQGHLSCNIHNILGILSDGKLAMCGIGVHVPELTYGQLGKNDLQDVWINNPTLNAIREQLPGEVDGICSECMFRMNCFAFCVAENYHLSERLTAPFWFCEQAQSMGLFPKSRRFG